MEHVERQEEREQDLKDDLDQLEEQGDQLEKRKDEFGEKVGDVREEFESKQDSPEAPGLQPDDETSA